MFDFNYLYNYLNIFFKMNKFKSIIPLLNRVLIRKLVPEAKTIGGIILSDKSIEKEARIGIVVTTGPGVYSERGMLIPVKVNVGDHVLLPEYQGVKVPNSDMNEYLIYKESELLAVLENVRKV